MTMYSFKNDYAEGAHPQILNALMHSNLEQHTGYGEDLYSMEAKALLRQEMQAADAAIFLVSGGTQSNLLVIAALLRPHEAVLSAATGHIYANETGAIEATGHRVIPVPSSDGKLTVDAITQVLANFQLRPHTVKPRMVYLSNATEIGSHYTKKELVALYHFCQSQQLLLFMDGARLGNALMAKGSDLTLALIAGYTDVFYIGGTKNGALLGEAIVFPNPDLATDFDYICKQRGALLAKGRVLGIQFVELFKNGLYYTLASTANGHAAKLSAAFSALGYSFLCPSSTNQIFPIIPEKLIQLLAPHYAFYTWKKIDDLHSAIRMITSWATEADQVDAFIQDIKRFQDQLRTEE